MKKLVKGLKIVGVVVLVALVLVITGVSVYTGSEVEKNMIGQNIEKDTRAASEGQLELWDYDQAAFEKTYSIKEMTIDGADDYTIPFAVIGGEIEAGDQVALLVHGLGGDYVCVYPQAEIYLEQGWKVVAIDQRSSGLSEDDRVTFGYLEKTDLPYLVEYIESQNNNGTIVLHGFSMGATTCGLYAGTDHASEHVDAFILDSAFDSFEKLFARMWTSWETGIPTDYVIFCSDITLKLKHGFSYDDVNVCETIVGCQTPVLVIQSRNDDLCPLEMGQAIFEANPNADKDMWVPESTHIDAYIDFPEEYTEKVLDFLEI